MKTLLAGAILLAGCSSSEPGTSAGVSVDASLADAGTQNVRITVTRAGVPEPDVRVFFHEEGGALEDTRTNAAGQASSQGAVPMVTLVLDVDDRPRELFTYMGVRAGDQLALELPGPSVDVSLFDLQLSALVPEATSYEVSGGHRGCAWAWAYTQGVTPPGILSLRSLRPCLTTPSALLLTARSSASRTDGDFQAIGYAVVDTPAPEAGRSLPLSVGTFGIGENVTLTAAGADEAAFVEYALWYAKASTLARLSPRAEIEPVRNERTFLLPLVRGDALLAEVSLHGRSSTHTFQQRSATATGFTIPVGPDVRLPAISGFGTQRDYSMRPITWRADESAEHDASLVVLNVKVPPPAGELGNTASWTFALPPAQRSFTPPSLPQLGPNTHWQTDRVMHVRTSAVRGYDAYRNRTLRYRTFTDNQLLIDETPAEGETSEVLTYADPVVIE